MFAGAEWFFLFAGALLGVVFDRLARWWTNTARDYELWYSISVEPIYRRGPGDGLTGVVLSRNGVELADPQVVTLTLWSSGARDIASSAFEEKPFVLGLGISILEELEARSNEATGLEIELSEAGELTIQPGTIRRDFALYRRVLANGEVTRSLGARLVDTDLSYYEQVVHKAARRAWLHPGFLILAILVSSFAFATAGIASGPLSEPGKHFAALAPWSSTFYTLAAVAFIYAMVVVTQLGSGGSRRARRAARRLRKSLGDTNLLVPKPSVDS